MPPLVLHDARRMFLQIAGAGFATDPNLDGLLGTVDGVPLAVELLGYAAQGQPELAQLEQRWQQERVGLLERLGGGRRELSVPVSIELSLTDPRMTPEGRRLLALLGQLPDGIAHQDLTALLPSVGLRAAATLRQVRLVFDEADRLRMLAPIRDHAETAHPPQPADLDHAVTHYCQLANTVGWRVGAEGGAEAAQRILTETGNLTRMLDQAIITDRLDQVVAAVVGLVEYMRFTGTTLPGLLDAARAVVDRAGTDAQRADIHVGLGSIAVQRSDYDTAQARFQQALPLYQQAGGVVGEANCIKSLGDIAWDRSDHDTAQARFEEALVLYERIRDPYSIGVAQHRLATLASTESERAQRLAATHQAWASIGRTDPVEMLGEISRDGDDDT